VTKLATAPTGSRQSASKEIVVELVSIANTKSPIREKGSFPENITALIGRSNVMKISAAPAGTCTVKPDRLFSRKNRLFEYWIAGQPFESTPGSVVVVVVVVEINSLLKKGYSHVEGLDDFIKLTIAATGCSQSTKNSTREVLASTASTKSPIGKTSTPVDGAKVSPEIELSKVTNTSTAPGGTSKEKPPCSIANCESS